MEEMEKKLNEAFIYDTSPLLRKKLRMKNKIAIGLIIILVISVSYNSYLSYWNTKRDKVIINYHQRNVGNSVSHIVSAYNNMHQAINSYDSKERLADNLRRAGYNLETAAEYVKQYNTYYEYSDKDNITYNSAEEFFRSYVEVLNSWAGAIYTNNEEEMPTLEEIEKMSEDIMNVLSKVSNENITELNSNELKDLFIKLADETQTEPVRKNLDVIFYKY